MPDACALGRLPEGNSQRAGRASVRTGCFRVRAGCGCREGCREVLERGRMPDACAPRRFSQHTLQTLGRRAANCPERFPVDAGSEVDAVFLEACGRSIVEACLEASVLTSLDAC